MLYPCTTHRSRRVGLQEVQEIEVEAFWVSLPFRLQLRNRFEAGLLVVLLNRHLLP